MKGIPEQIQTWLDGREWEENDIGMSGSRVLTAEDRVLKIQRVSPEADNEYRGCRWLAHKIPVPEILAYEIVGDKACCLMTRVCPMFLRTGTGSADLLIWEKQERQTAGRILRSATEA